MTAPSRAARIGRRDAVTELLAGDTIAEAIQALAASDYADLIPLEHREPVVRTIAGSFARSLTEGSET